MKGLTRRRLAIGSGVMFDSLSMSMSTLNCIECKSGGWDNPRVPKMAAISRWVIHQVEKSCQVNHMDHPCKNERDCDRENNQTKHGRAWWWKKDIAMKKRGDSSPNRNSRVICGVFCVVDAARVAFASFRRGKESRCRQSVRVGTK